MQYAYIAIVILSLLRDLRGTDIDTKKYADLAKGLFPLLLAMSTGGQLKTLKALEEPLTGKGGLIDMVADLF